MEGVFRKIHNCKRKSLLDSTCLCRLAENLIQNQYHANENTDPISILYYHHMLQSSESFHQFFIHKTQFIKKKDRFTIISISTAISVREEPEVTRNNEVSVRLYFVGTTFRQWSCYVCSTLEERYFFFDIVTYISRIKFQETLDISVIPCFQLPFRFLNCSILISI